MNNNTLRLVDVTIDNFADFKELVLQQAKHHLCDYVGDDEAFLSEITNLQSPAHVMMAWCLDSDQAMGYVLYNVMYGVKGKEIYIEDILVRQDVRSKGVGNFFFEQLKGKARISQCDAVSWVVARNNTRAIDFYTTKQNACPVNKIGYDCTHALSQEFNSQSNTINIHSICGRDIEVLAQMAENGSMGITYEMVRNIQDAYDQPHVQAMMASDICGTPLALIIANSNYSSFRTVYGYKVEMMELTDNPSQAFKGMMALSDRLTAIARDTHHEGHLNIFINPRSRVQVNVIDAMNGIEFKMSDHPNSHLDLYAIDRKVIHDINPQLAKLDNVYQIDSYAKLGKFIIR